MPVRLGPFSAYCFCCSGIVLIPTRARYSSACSRSLPARSTIFSRLSIDETSSSCSVRNHCRKLIGNRLILHLTPEFVTILLVISVDALLTRKHKEPSRGLRGCKRIKLYLPDAV